MNLQSKRLYRGYTEEMCARDLQLKSVAELRDYFNSGLSLGDFKETLAYRDYVEAHLDHIELDGVCFVAVAYEPYSYYNDETNTVEFYYRRHEYVYNKVFDL